MTDELTDAQKLEVVRARVAALEARASQMAFDHAAEILSRDEETALHLKTKEELLGKIHLLDTKLEAVRLVLDPGVESYARLKGVPAEQGVPPDTCSIIMNLLTLRGIAVTAGAVWPELYAEAATPPAAEVN